jgi:uncharacterized membrane protein
MTNFFEERRLNMGKFLRRWFLFPFIISMVISFIVIPAFSEGTQIWTEDWQGNPRTDFEPDENVYILGSGFNPNAQIDISITRPDNVIENYSTFSDENGCFLYIYTLDGMVGTYYVTATDGVNSASTTFEDCLRILEGYDKAATRWERGLLEGWKELDWVPYRIKFARLPKGTSSFNFKVCHNNLLDNKDGVDKLRNFRVGSENGDPVNGSVTASGPFYKTPGKECDRDIYYSLSVTFTTPSSGLSWYVYWEAHVAFGASGWPGAKLHAYTENLTGSQDVPIKVPPTPVGSISGTKWNDSNCSGTWDPGEPGLPGWTIQLYFFDPVENTWINIDNEGTGAGGSYTFSGLVAGNYRVTEVLKENWMQTYPPSPGSHSITLSEGENRTGVNFGNALIIHDVEVSITPTNQGGLNGQTLYYTVTVVNTGNILDTYDLQVSDDLGWGPNISPSSLTVPAGENRTSTLSVTIPSNATGGTQDTVTVSAISRADNTVSDSFACIAKVLVARGVDVLISPHYQTGVPGENLIYSVTIANIGNISDTYDLTVSENLDWGPSISPSSVTVSPFSSGSATLSVVVPLSGIGCTEDNITVTAVSRSDNMVSDSGNCIAHATIVRGVDVSISPDYQSGLNGATLSYVVTITNVGNVPDNYDLSVNDNLGWSPNISPSSFTLAPGAHDNASMSITISLNATGCTEDLITVIARSRSDDAITGDDSCIAHVTIVRGVRVSISPGYRSGLNGARLEYTATVSNTGNVEDTYSLTATDDAGWSPNISPISLTVPPWENRTATLSVTVPENALGCTQDNIIVTAVGLGVENSAACIAHAVIFRGVDVSISPDYQSGSNGATLTYTVTVANTGNVPDTYNLTANDDTGWGSTLSPTSLIVPPWENRISTLTVTLPSNAFGCTVDNMTVAATGTEVSDSDSCIAHITIVRAVEVSISPSYKTGLPGTTLNYTVTVANTGNVSDTYDLVASDNLGWGPTVSPNSLTVPPWESRTVILSVTIPENAEGCTLDNIWVVATSRANPAVKDNDSSIAHADYVTRGVDLSLSPNHQSGKPGAVLSYMVTVINTGNVEDNYILNVTDNENWSLIISPASLAIPPGGSDNALLIASIPEKARGSMRDNIKVDAVSAENSEVSASGVAIASVENVRGVIVEITPSYKGGLPGTVLVYSCRITNTGNVEDTYDVTFWDNENWDVAFTIEAIHLPPYSWAETTPLKVTVPENAPPCTEDNITIRAVSRENNMIENMDSCIAHRDWAKLSLITKYLVNVDLNFYLENGSKLALRFYDFSDVFEGENVILENLATPTQIVFNDNVHHPLGKGIKKVAVVALSDNGSIIQTMQTFVVHRTDLWKRLSEIRMEWPYATPEERSALWAELSDIRVQWPYALP